MKAVKALLQFTTILPLGKPADFDRFAANSWLYPLAGYVTGGIAAIPALIAWLCGITNSLIIAAITLALVIAVSGGNHFDGLLDLGDGLMAHGSREKRISAMKDRTTGAGALAAGILVVLLTFAGLASLPVWMIGISVLAAEVLGKMVMGLSSALGKPFADGIQKYIYDHSKRRFAVYTILLALPILLLGFIYPVCWWISAAFAGAILTFVILFLLAKKLFGGVNGDVTGASNELTRMVVLVILGILVTAAA
ncbi:MAG TPA: adenosylcobinamide-GDP ribazoletransferase [Methanocorpusculum sp.]|nr:adenosylcobinamide-GDP ribazoletransferase [Methanocorpusculum sp.]